MSSWMNHRSRSRKTYRRRMSAARWFLGGRKERKRLNLMRFGM